MVKQTQTTTPQPSRRDSWFAVPKKAGLPVVNGSVPEHYRWDYHEAWLILEDSPRMSAVLSRKLTTDLLKEYCGFEDKLLSKRIDRFAKDASHPSELAKNLDYSREIGNFSAHTMLDGEGNIIEVKKKDAVWTLEVVADLFDYLIVSPERLRQRRERFDKKLAEANRKPIAGPG